MANFSARITIGGAPADWVDAPGALPSRLNATSGLPHSYIRVPQGRLIVVACTPDGGAEGAPDSALGGNLFTCYWVESPYLGGPALVQAAGTSSIIQSTIVTSGHYLLGIFRPSGGARLLHFNCE